MHAVVQGGFFERVIQLLSGAAITHGVKQSHLYIGVRIQRLIGAVATRVVDIIEQYPYPHAAIGGLQHFVGQCQPTFVRLPKVVLNIKGSSGERR